MLRNKIYVSFTKKKMSSATNGTLMTCIEDKSFSNQKENMHSNDSCMLAERDILNFAYVISLIFFLTQV